MVSKHSSFFSTPEGSVFIGAGPCSAESPEQLEQTAAALASTGMVKLMRAGIWKPRTRPGSFEGYGSEALQWLANAGHKHGLATATEVANAEHVEEALKAGIDVLWLGARTTVNPFYVQEIAEALSGVDIPVMVKNPMHPELGLWIGALERLEHVGIKELAAVHRGFFSTSAGALRNDPKWELAVSLRERLPDLPLFCDPSHISGKRSWVAEVAQTALDLRYDGLLIEVHPSPETALSDSAQQWPLADFDRFIRSLEVRTDESTMDALPIELQDIRSEIDRLDREIVELLGRRFSLLAPIASIKKEEGLALFQIERWLEILKTRKDWGRDVQLSGEVLQEIFEAIHKHGLLRQVENWRTGNERAIRSKD